jgi:hypothetical protein
VAAGEIYLLCSDGLCGYVSDTEIKNCILANSTDLKAATEALIQAANSAGGLDNSTVALVRIDENGTDVPVSVESVTLPEETEEDLARLDQVLGVRYQEDGKYTEETTDGQTGRTAPAVTAETSGHRRWQWLLLLVLVAIGIALLLWPGTRVRRPAETATTSESPALQPEPPQAAMTDSLALLFLAAGTADRASIAYLDGVDQGTLNDLEYGLLLEPGHHTLAVINRSGDTLFTRTLDVEAHDTIDLVVR